VHTLGAAAAMRQTASATARKDEVSFIFGKKVVELAEDVLLGVGQLLTAAAFIPQCKVQETIGVAAGQPGPRCIRQQVV
jgi:hypothetical protein